MKQDTYNLIGNVWNMNIPNYEVIDITADELRDENIQVTIKLKQIPQS